MIILGSSPAITGHATCDNEMWFFADGKQLAYSDNWQIASPISMPLDTQVIGIKCNDYHVIAGIKAAFDTGEKTDNTWKCSTSVTEGWSEAG